MSRWLTLFLLLQASGVETVALFVDNDGVAGTDSEYSSGVRLSAVLEESENGAWKGLSLSHQIFTPESFFLSDPPLDERPYSAWLAIGYGHGVVEDGHTRSIEWSLGVTGDWALGEPLQDAVHNSIGLEAFDFQGWDEQIPTEPVFNVFYDEEWRVWQTVTTDKGLSAELWLGVEADLGTFSTGVGGSALFRVGWNIGERLSAVRNSYTAYRFDAETAAPRVSVFTGVDVKYLAHQLSLDGGVFRDFETEVDPIRFRVEWATGMSYEWRQYAVSLGYVVRTAEFEQQAGDHQYGYFSLSYGF